MIDAHFHIWQLARADYGWLTPALQPIYRDVTLDDWRAVSRPCGVRGGILVQAAPTAAETDFLLTQAADADDVLGVVGWADLLAADAPRRIEALARHPKLKGLRPMLHDLADPGWILQPALHPALQAMADCGLTFDALVRPVHLPSVHALALRHPDLRIVIDHAAKPDIAQGQWLGWADALERLAGECTVYCKLSGLWTEAVPGASVETLAGHARWVLACFGPRRTLWGSDWPVLALAGAYAAWHAMALSLVANEARAAVFEQAARDAYAL